MCVLKPTHILFCHTKLYTRPVAGHCACVSCVGKPVMVKIIDLWLFHEKKEKKHEKDQEVGLLENIVFRCRKHCVCYSVKNIWIFFSLFFFFWETAACHKAKKVLCPLTVSAKNKYS